MRSRVDIPGRKPIKSGSQSTTAVEQTTYNSMSEKTVNTPILQPCIASEGSFPNARGARNHFPLTPIDEATMTSVMEKVHEYEKCPCVRPKAPDRKVRFMDMVPTDFVSDNRGVESKGELRILTPKLKGNISIVSEPEWQEIEITVDSGACDTVMPTRMCAHISIVATAKSRSGFDYEVANGDGLLNIGERRCFMMTENLGTMKRIAFQCADVR